MLSGKKQPQIAIVAGMLNIVPKRLEPDEYFKPWSLRNFPKLLFCSQEKGEESKKTFALFSE